MPTHRHTTWNNSINIRSIQLLNSPFYSHQWANYNDMSINEPNVGGVKMKKLWGLCKQQQYTWYEMENHNDQMSFLSDVQRPSDSKLLLAKNYFRSCLQILASRNCTSISGFVWVVDERTDSRSEIDHASVESEVNVIFYSQKHLHHIRCVLFYINPAFPVNPECWFVTEATSMGTQTKQNFLLSRISG